MSDASLDPDLEPTLGTHLPVSHLVVVFVGGALGTLARYVVVKHWIVSNHSLPWSLVTINATGSFLLGLLATSFFISRADLVGIRLFCSTGLLGGWTTYSSYAVAVLLLGHHHAWSPALWLVLATALGGPLVAWLGRRLGSAVVKAQR